MLVTLLLVTQALASPQEHLSRYVVEKGIVGAVAGRVEVGGGPTEVDVQVWGAGYQDLEAGVLTDVANARWRLASISKAITATIALRLEARGLLSLDVPIQRYLRGFRMPRYWTRRLENTEGLDAHVREAVPPGVSITLRHLLSNTSGYPFYRDGWVEPQPHWTGLENPESHPGLGGALAAWIGGPLIALPGATFIYTTLGFNLAGVVLEAITSLRFEELLKNEVGDPLGIETLSVEYVWQRNENHVRGYRRDERFELRTERMTDVGWKAPGGGMTISGPDMARLCRGWLDDTYLTAEMKQHMWTPTQLSDGSFTPYGLGFEIREGDGVSHDGEQEGASTRFQISTTRQRTCSFILTNTRYANLKHETFLNGLDEITRSSATSESPAE